MGKFAADTVGIAKSGIEVLQMDYSESPEEDPDTEKMLYAADIEIRISKDSNLHLAFSALSWILNKYGPAIPERIDFNTADFPLSDVHVEHGYPFGDPELILDPVDPRLGRYQTRWDHTGKIYSQNRQAVIQVPALGAME